MASTSANSGSKKEKVKHFRCELCNVRQVYSEHNYNEHLKCLAHVYMQYFCDYNLWPGKGNTMFLFAEKKQNSEVCNLVHMILKRTDEAVQSEKPYWFVNKNDARVVCLPCRTFVDDALDLMQHQMADTHVAAVETFGFKPQTIPRLFYCTLCSVYVGHSLIPYQRHLRFDDTHQRRLTVLKSWEKDLWEAEVEKYGALEPLRDDEGSKRSKTNKGRDRDRVRGSDKEKRQRDKNEDKEQQNKRRRSDEKERTVTKDQKRKEKEESRKNTVATDANAIPIGSSEVDEHDTTQGRSIANEWNEQWSGQTARRRTFPSRSKTRTPDEAEIYDKIIAEGCELERELEKERNLNHGYDDEEDERELDDQLEHYARKPKRPFGVPQNGRFEAGIQKQNKLLCLHRQAEALAKNAERIKEQLSTDGAGVWTWPPTGQDSENTACASTVTSGTTTSTSGFDATNPCCNPTFTDNQVVHQLMCTRNQVQSDNSKVAQPPQPKIIRVTTDNPVQNLSSLLASAHGQQMFSEVLTDVGVAIPEDVAQNEAGPSTSNEEPIPPELLPDPNTAEVMYQLEQIIANEPADSEMRALVQQILDERRAQLEHHKQFVRTVQELQRSRDQNPDIGTAAKRPEEVFTTPSNEQMVWIWHGHPVEKWLPTHIPILSAHEYYWELDSKTNEKFERIANQPRTDPPKTKISQWIGNLHVALTVDGVLALLVDAVKFATYEELRCVCSEFSPIVGAVINTDDGCELLYRTLTNYETPPAAKEMLVTSLWKNITPVEFFDCLWRPKCLYLLYATVRLSTYMSLALRSTIVERVFLSVRSACSNRILYQKHVEPKKLKPVFDFVKFVILKIFTQQTTNSILRLPCKTQIDMLLSGTNILSTVRTYIGRCCLELLLGAAKSNDDRDELASYMLKTVAMDAGRFCQVCQIYNKLPLMCLERLLLHKHLSNTERKRPFNQSTAADVDADFEFDARSPQRRRDEVRRSRDLMAPFVELCVTDRAALIRSAVAHNPGSRNVMLHFFDMAPNYIRKRLADAIQPCQMELVNGFGRELWDKVQAWRRIQSESGMIARGK